jgi:glycosyltransferase involved in cell wall biosynthesis
MHLVLVTAFQYPDGGPAAARHMALASGLAAHGHQVTFILLNQTEAPEGLVLDPAVRWLSVASTRARSPIGWRLAASRRLGAALDSIRATHPVDAVLLIDRDPILFERGLRAARKRGLPALHEITEYPDIVRSPGMFGQASQLCFLRRHLPALDGVLVISRPLHDYVAQRASVPTQLVGPLVDLTAHTPLPPLELTTTLVIGYAGSLSQQKDGILTLLRAAATAAERLSPEISVRLELLGGDLTSPAGQAAARESLVLGLQDRVVFHGQVPHAEVRGYLSKCHVLVLPRPVSRQASGGFPTKLGEYLSTARPVITTAVGDIPRYVTRNDSCLMVPPNDGAALAGALVAIASDYTEAQAIGARGRQLVETSFAATVQAPKVISFIEHLRGSDR